MKRSSKHEYEAGGADRTSNVCKAKAEFLEAYHRLTKKYSDAVAALHRDMGTLSKLEYDSLYQVTEELHADVTRAQGEFNSHVQSHKC
jgi:hypothetical protein